MTDGTVLVQAEGMTVVPVDDTIFFYDDDAQQFYMLNPSASEIYRRCDGRSTIGEISRELAALHPDEATEIPLQVRDTVAGLIELRIVRGTG